MHFIKYCLILFIFFSSNSAVAIEKIKDLTIDDKEPVYITADELIFSKDSGIAKAYGYVEIEQNNQFIFSDEVSSI